MSFFYKFITGGAVAAGLTLYYHDDIARTTDKLSNDLHDLSRQLVRAAPSQQQSTEVEGAAGRTVIPQRLAFSEELKARWNEQLGSALYSLQTANYADLFSRTFSQLRSAVNSAQSAASSSATEARAEVTAVKTGERQV
ncbi:hypothetical protein JCM11641_008462 [Rhodosporidiobolus odoratus]